MTSKHKHALSLFLALTFASNLQAEPLAQRQKEELTQPASIRPQIGYAQKFSTGFGENYNLIEDVLLSTPELAPELSLQFQQKCGDNDSEDTISWEVAPATPDLEAHKSISFACFVGSNPETGTVYTFILDYPENKIQFMAAHNIRSVTNDILAPSDDPRPASLGLRTAKNETELQAQKNRQLKFVLSESTALIVSGLVSTQLAEKFFEGKKDKRTHAAVSSVMASLITSLSYHYGQYTLKESMLMGMIGSCAVGGMVELIQPHIRMNGKPRVREWNDMKANAIGCIIGSLGVALAIEIMN